MRRGAVPADVEQVRFVVGGRDAGERTHLGVAEFALGQRLGKEREVFQRTRDANLLARGMGIDAARPTEPVRARHRPLGGPQLAPVEFGDEDEQARKLRRECGRRGLRPQPRAYRRPCPRNGPKRQSVRSSWEEFRSRWMNERDYTLKYCTDKYST